MRQFALVLLASALCLSIFLAPVSATAAEGTGSGLVLKAGFGCKLEQGKLICGKTKKGDDGDDDDDDDDDDDVKPETEGDDAELSECTIQQPGSGGGCKTGFRWVCEKMKSGKKCCGCVPDKNAEAPAAEKIEDHPCFTHCASTKCGGATKEVRDACVLDCLQSTNCTPH